MKFVTGALAKFFGTKTDITPPVSVPPAPPQQAELSDATYKDDSVLRALRDAYVKKETSWVLASDLDEFYTKMEAYNATVADDRKISLRIRSTIHDALVRTMEEGKHIKPAHTPTSMSGEDVFRHMGPQGVDGIQICIGIEGREAFYRSNHVLSSCLSIVGKNGTTKDFQFGMDYAEDEIRSAAPVTQALAFR